MLAVPVIVVLLDGSVHAVDCGHAFADRYVRSFESVTPIPYGNEINRLIDNYDKACCHQNRVIALFKARGRQPIGYKVAASSFKSQKKIGAPGPIPGVLFSGMMLPDGARIKRGSGVFLIYEADMLVRVGSNDIVHAQTKMEVLRSLDAVIPFIEVADSMLSKSVELTGNLLCAMNAGARWGVVGDPIAIEANQAFLDALATMRVTLEGKGGEVLADAHGSAILDHPLNAALFLIDQARQRGWTIQKGHLMSLGSVGGFQVVRPGLEGHLTYRGLPGGPATVSVYFE